MAELADALDLGSSAREGVGVQVSPGARRISEMRTRFSDLVFSYWGNSAATAAASRAVSGRPTHQSHQLRRLLRLTLVPHRALPTLGWRYRAPTCAEPTYAPRSRWCRTAPCTGPATRRHSEPLFHHAVSKRPDHQLHTIMCSRLCHGGRQVGLYCGWL